MIDWPQLDELKQVLDADPNTTVWDGIDTSGEGATRLTRLLEAAIENVKHDVGNWDDLTDWPDANLAQAALRGAELLALKPEIASAASGDPTYQRLIRGYRRKFAIS